MLDIDVLIGQHFVCGFPSTTLDAAFIEAVRRYKIGNIILFSRNIRSKEQLSCLCKEIQDLVQGACGIPAFITIDQEGGMVSRLSADCTTFPPAMAIAATGEERNAWTAGYVTALELRAMGVNVNFAPVLDVNTNKDNPVIGVRSYGDTSDRVSRFGLAMVQGLEEGGVLAVGKHFPGHGDTHVDSHLALPTIQGEMERHLRPFKQVIANDIHAIMSTHILFPDLEKQNLPATLSRTILTDYLKNQLGFKGLVFSDCMEMQAIADNYGTAEASVTALKAGVDLVCIGHHVQMACHAIDNVKRALDEGALELAALRASTQKIVEMKQFYQLLEQPDLSLVGQEANRSIVRLLTEQSLTLVNDVPFRLKKKPLFIGPKRFKGTHVADEEETLVFSQVMAELLGGFGLVCSPDPDKEEMHRILLVAKEYESVVMGTYNAHLNPGQVALANALVEDRPVCCVALGNPYDLSLLDGRIRSIACYAYTREVCEALFRVFRHSLLPTGTLPVQL